MDPLAALIAAHEQRSQGLRNHGPVAGGARVKTPGDQGNSHPREVSEDDLDIARHEAHDLDQGAGQAQSGQAREQVTDVRGGGKQERGEYSKGGFSE